METSLQEARRLFNEQPLFGDDGLASELAAFEHRRRVVEMQKHAEAEQENLERLQASRLLATTKSVDLSPYRVSAIRNRQSASVPPNSSEQSHTQVQKMIPPPVPRPWSVERLLKIGETLHSSPKGRHVTSSLSKDYASQLTALRPLPEDTYWQNDKVPTRRRTASRRRQPRAEAHAPATDDEHDYRFNGAYYAAQGGMHGHTDSSIRGYDRDELVALDGEDSDRGSSIFEFPTAVPRAKIKHTKEIAPSLMDAHIERASARKALQETRLRAMGIQAPGSRVEISTQADDGTERISLWSGKPLDSAAEVSKHIAAQAANAHRTFFDAAGDGLVLEPQLPIRRRKQFEPVTSSNTDTVWQRVLHEEKQLYDGRGDAEAASSEKPTSYGIPASSLEAPCQPYVPRVPNSWLSIVESTSNAEGFRPNSLKNGLSNMALPASNRAPDHTSEANAAALSHLAPAASDSILRKIDQMQLANEEMLVRNKVIRDPLPSSAGGAFSFNKNTGLVAQDPEEALTRAAISHVAAAYGDPASQEAALSRFRPVGGYGSVTDPNFRPSNSEGDRWASARHQNERHHLLTTEAEPLRAWATNLPTNYLGSLVDNGPSINVTKPSARGRPVNQYENSAKRKWGDVTFAVPNQHTIPPGTIERLSAKARESMYPTGLPENM